MLAQVDFQEARRRRRTRKIPQWRQEQERAARARRESVPPAPASPEPARRNAYDVSQQQRLRTTIRMLVELLSDTLKEQEGEELLNAVEELRVLSKARRTGDVRAGERINALISGWLSDTARIRAVLKAFTLYFQLVNIAEEQQRVRVLRQRARVAREQGLPGQENIAFALHWLYHKGMVLEDIEQLVASLAITPIFTAHPTEANRRTILFKHRVIADVLAELDVTYLSPDEVEARKHLINENIHSLWQTDENREQQPTVMDEVRHGLYYLSTTVFNLLPVVYRELEEEIRRYYPGFDRPLPIFFRYGSWIGGDRDGNPFVTCEVTRQALVEQRLRLLTRYLAEVEILFAHLSMSSNHVGFTDEFLAKLDQDLSQLPSHEQARLRPTRREPYRQMLAIIRRKLEATRERTHALWDEHAPDPMVYVRAEDLRADLEAVDASLRACQGTLLAEGRLSRLITCVRICGFYFATLDIRQHAERHAMALDEIFARYSSGRVCWTALSEDEKMVHLATELDTERPLTSALDFSDATNETVNVFRTVRVAKERLGEQAIDTYIISMAEHPSQMLEVLLLAKDASLFGRIDIVPLFESIEDLQRAPHTLRTLFDVPCYRTHLEHRGNRQTIMIGYSDSNKDGGYLSATWALYKVQIDIQAVCDRHGIVATLFHGRGGSVSRGGGGTMRTVTAQPPDTIRGRLRLTEQGEVITSHYAQPTIARRHMEQLVSAVLLRSRKTQGQPQEKEWAVVMEELSRIANQTYQTFVNRACLIRYFVETTPVNIIASLNIGSRPARRSQTRGVDDLRAIPWVFAWAQCRVNLTNWYGVGTALMTWLEQGPRADRVATLQSMYQDWGFFRILIENVRVALWKTDLFTASQYAELTDSDTRQVFDDIEVEFEKTRQGIMLVLDRKRLGDASNWLYRSIQLRNPYIDPLNFIQIALMKHMRTAAHDASAEERARWESALNLSVKGLAAGLHGTG